MVWVVLVVTGGLVIDWADAVVEEVKLPVIVGMELLLIVISDVAPVAERELLTEVSP